VFHQFVGRRTAVVEFAPSVYGNEGKRLITFFGFQSVRNECRRPFIVFVNRSLIPERIFSGNNGDIESASVLYPKNIAPTTRIRRVLDGNNAFQLVISFCKQPEPFKCSRGI